MSEMKSKVVTGDLSVGKNVAVGGRATIQGNTLIKGRLRVEGWLEANNVKVANKGLFETAESLRTSYPHPRDGWWALVGKKVPAPIYVGIGGDWVATGEEGGIAALDSDRYEQFISEVESMMSGIEEAFVQLTETDMSLDGKLTSHDAQIAKNELREVKVEVSGNTAKLTISTLGKSVTVALPIATTNGLGLMLGSDKVKLNNAYDIATEAKTTATSAQQTANSATTNISQALSQIASLAGVVASQAQTHNSDKTALDEAISALGTSVADNIRGLSEDIAGLSISHNTDKTALEAEMSTVKSTVKSQGENITALAQGQSQLVEEITRQLEELGAEIGPLLTEMQENLATTSQAVETHMKEVAVYGFDGMGPAFISSSVTALRDGVWYSTADKCFYRTTSGRPSKSVPHNENEKARTGVLFANDGNLFVFNGADLVGWEPDALSEVSEKVGNLEDFAIATSMRFTEVENSAKGVNTRIDTVESMLEDIEERFSTVEPRVSEHIAEVAIYAFNGDGPPSTSSSAYNGPAGIYYSQSEGLFYKTTSGSPSKSIPHNANGKARTDCLYRKGNVLYQYNGSTLSEYVSPSVAAELAELRSLIANLG